jgi:hypothetical protein
MLPRPDHIKTETMGIMKFDAGVCRFSFVYSSCSCCVVTENLVILWLRQGLSACMAEEVGTKVLVLF